MYTHTLIENKLEPSHMCKQLQIVVSECVVVLGIGGDGGAVQCQ